MNTSVAQSEERIPPKDEAGGSIPSGRTTTKLTLAVKHLSGTALDWAVATVMGYEPVLMRDDDNKLIVIAIFARSPTGDLGHVGPFAPSVKYEQGMPLADQYEISCELSYDVWAAGQFRPQRNEWANVATGPTRLIALMRSLYKIRSAFAHSGEFVSVPEELVLPEWQRYVMRPTGR